MASMRRTMQRASQRKRIKSPQKRRSKWMKKLRGEGGRGGKKKTGGRRK